jgi:hypothetical protein
LFLQVKELSQQLSTYREALDKITLVALLPSKAIENDLGEILRKARQALAGDTKKE